MDKQYMKALYLIAGFLAGIFVTLFVVQHATQIFFIQVGVDYSVEQELLAIKAKKENRIEDAIRHYSNLVEYYSDPGLNTFSRKRCERRGACSFFSPFILFVDDYFSQKKFEEMRKGSAMPSSSYMKKGSEKMFMMRRAYLYDQIGRPEKARKEYENILRISTGNTQVSKEKYIENMKIVGKGDEEFEESFFQNMSRMYDMRF